MHTPARFLTLSARRADAINQRLAGWPMEPVGVAASTHYDF